MVFVKPYLLSVFLISIIWCHETRGQVELNQYRNSHSLNRYDKFVDRTIDLTPQESYHYQSSYHHHPGHHHGHGGHGHGHRHGHGGHGHGHGHGGHGHGHGHGGHGHGHGHGGHGHGHGHGHGWGWGHHHPRVHHVYHTHRRSRVLPLLLAGFAAGSAIAVGAGIASGTIGK